jgi:hypothetical protein
MALTDKNIVITPNIGQTADPKIVFSGADASTAAQNITLQVYPTNNGTLSFEGSAGQLLSINNSLSGTIYSVNDVSGIPSIEVLDTGLIKLGQYSGNVVLGSAVDNGVDKLQVAGSATISAGTADSPLTLTVSDSAWNYISFKHGTTRKAYFGLDSSGAPIIGSDSGVIGFTGNYVQSDASFRAPIFYDSNNTAYYSDPAGTSNLNALTVATLNSNLVFTQTASPQLKSDYSFSFLTSSNGAQAGKFLGIQVSDSYTGSIPTNGILFGTDTQLVRGAANQLDLGGNRILHAGNLTSYTVYTPGGLSVDKSSTDLNTLTAAGFYRGSSMTNAPDTGWWYVIVEAHDNNANAANGWTKQTATAYGSGNSVTAGTTYVRVRTGSTTWNGWIKLVDAGNYNSYAPSLTGTGASGTWGISISGTASNSTNLNGSAASYYDHRGYNVGNNYLGAYYQSGAEKPNDAIFGAGKLKLAMLSSSNLGFGGSWNDVLWLSSYTGGDVKGSYALVFDKYSDQVYFARQNYDSATWGTGRALLHSGNYAGYSTFTGAVTSGGNTGFRNDVYYAGARNPIWSFGNSTSYGISYFQGTAGISSADVIGIHPNGTATATGAAFAVSPSNSYVNNNIVLHAGNYNSYLNNTFIRAIGGASTSNDWNSLGNTYPNTVEQINTSNFSSTANGPTAASYQYGVLLNLSAQSSAQAQIYVSHAGNDLMFRGGWDGASWQTWNKALTNQNYNSYSPTLTGGNASGTWGINITGSAGSVSGGSVSASSIYNSGFWYTFNDTTRNAGATTWYPNVVTRGVAWYFADASSTGTGGNYAGVMQFHPWTGTTASTGDASYQLAFGSTAANSGGTPQLRIRKGIDTTWNSWYDLLTSANYTNYAAPVTHYHDRIYNGASGSSNYLLLSSSNEIEFFNSSGVLDTMYLQYSGDVNSLRGPAGNIVLNAGNYNSYSPSLTGGNASGTWGISISGNAATVTNFKSFGQIVVGPNGAGANITTAQLITHLTNLGMFNYAVAVGKCSWDYAGNNDLTDTGFGNIDLAGCVIETWISSGAEKHVRITRPTTGAGGFQVLVYNDQGSGYSPGWRAMMTSENITSYAPTLLGSGASGTWGISITGESRSVNLGGSGHYITNSAWAGGSGYHGYTYSGGNWRFGFSSSGGVVDVYADGNFYATDSSYLVLHAGNYTSYAVSSSGGSAIVKNVPAISNNSYQNTNNHLELRTTDGSNPTLGFHRAGYTAVALYHSNNNELRLRDANTGADSLMLHSGNISSYALPLSGGTLTGALTVASGSTGEVFTIGSGTSYLKVNNSGGNVAFYGASSVPLIFGQNGSASSGLTIPSSGVATWLGNALLHAGNYTSYSPSLTGSGASGTWGINITGSAGSASSATTATTATGLNSSNYISRTGSSGNLNTDFNNTPAGTQRYQGDDSNLTNSPGNTWWIYEHKRHSNGTNYWGTQVAWGWEDNSNRLMQRNVSGGTWTGWVEYLNTGGRTFSGSLTMSGNITAYSDETLKTNWRSLPSDYVYQLSQVKCGVYDRIDIELTQEGVSAQSLQTVLPYSVIKDEDDKLSVNYGSAALVSTVELAKKVVEQEARIAHLEALISKLIKE